MRNVSPTSGGRIFSCDLRPDPAAASERRLPKIHGSHRAASCTCGLILRLSFEDLSPTATGTNHAQTYRLILHLPRLEVPPTQSGFGQGRFDGGNACNGFTRKIVPPVTRSAFPHPAFARRTRIRPRRRVTGATGSGPAPDSASPCAASRNRSRRASSSSNVHRYDGRASRA